MEQSTSSMRVEPSEEESTLCLGQVVREANDPMQHYMWSLGSVMMFNGM